MEHLWAPWRTKYIEESSQKEKLHSECIFCVYPNQGVESYTTSLILYSNKHAFVIMNRYPYNAGHLMVVPKSHVSDPSQLVPDEFSTLCLLLKETISLMKQTFKPEGINVGMNLGKTAGAGIEDHCHFHVVPRWQGDTNFMPVLAETKVISESLLDTYNKLLPIFQQFK